MTQKYNGTLIYLLDTLQKYTNDFLFNEMSIFIMTFIFILLPCFSNAIILSALGLFTHEFIRSLKKCNFYCCLYVFMMYLLVLDINSVFFIFLKKYDISLGRNILSNNMYVNGDIYYSNLLVLVSLLLGLIFLQILIYCIEIYEIKCLTGYESYKDLFLELKIVINYFVLAGINILINVFIISYIIIDIWKDIEYKFIVVVSPFVISILSAGIGCVMYKRSTQVDIASSVYPREIKVVI
ncbi:hypothetical protein CWI39_0027p0050 [Hamiltosporidium magnivora]|uniref:Uncharacterized protein n=1 Tax=Hamiltosporidium magnivora TaxID=148818 RepID=A0A4Q9LN97_9MICR|nr:hypothetical protein CWI39_0027p0050 [Hamiltosporidium magnivora]